MVTGLRKALDLFPKDSWVESLAPIVASGLCGGGKSVLRRSGMPMGGGLKQHFLPLGKDPIRLEAPAVGLGGLGQPVPQGRVTHQQRHGPGKFVDILRRNEQAVLAMLHHFRRSPRAIERYDRKPRRHRFKKDDSPAFVPRGKDENVGAFYPAARSLA